MNHSTSQEVTDAKKQAPPTITIHSTPSTKSWAVGLILLFVSLLHFFMVSYDTIYWLGGFSQISFASREILFPSDILRGLFPLSPLYVLELVMGGVVALIGILFLVAFWLQLKRNYHGLLFERVLRYILLAVYCLYLISLIVSAISGAWVIVVSPEMLEILIYHIFIILVFAGVLALGVIGMSNYMKQYATEEHYPLHFPKK